MREIGRVKAAPAVHQLTRALEDLNVLQRTYETKKEVIRALEQIGTPEAQRALRRTADRTFVLGQKEQRAAFAGARTRSTNIDAADTQPTEGADSTVTDIAVPSGERRAARHARRDRRRDDRFVAVAGAVRHAREARARPRPRAHAGRRRHQRRALPDDAPARRAVARRPRRRGARARATFGFDEVTVNIYKGTVFVENQVFSEESVTYSKLVEELLGARHLGGHVHVDR